MFYFSKYTFDRISEAVLFDAVAVVFATETTDQIVCVIDEKQSVLDIVFLSQFSEKLSCDRNRIRRKQPRVKDSVRLRIDGSVQLVLLVVDPDRFLIDRNAVRVLTVSWL